MSSYPYGTPAPTVTGVYTNTGDYSADAMVAGIIDNYSPVNKNTLRRTIGKELSKLANFVNSTLLGRSDTPVADGYISNLHGTEATLAKEGTVDNGITTVLRLQSKDSNVSPVNGFGSAVEFIAGSLTTGRVEGLWDSQSSAHGAVKLRGSHAGTLYELFTAVASEYNNVTIKYGGDKLFKWGADSSNMEIGSGLLVDRYTGAISIKPPADYSDSPNVEMVWNVNGSGAAIELAGSLLLWDGRGQTGTMITLDAETDSISARSISTNIGDIDNLNSDIVTVADTLTITNADSYTISGATLEITPDKSRMELTTNYSGESDVLFVSPGAPPVGSLLFISRLTSSAYDNTVYVRNYWNGNIYGTIASGEYNSTLMLLKTSEEDWSRVL
jgi:hypothetical protein